VCAATKPTRICCISLLQDTLGSAVKASGVDVDNLSRTTAAVTRTAEEGVTAAKPFLTQAVSFLTTTDPVSELTQPPAATGQPCSRDSSLQSSNR
jgi:hypothetical protein